MSCVCINEACNKLVYGAPCITTAAQDLKIGIGGHKFLPKSQAKSSVVEHCAPHLFSCKTRWCLSPAVLRAPQAKAAARKPADQLCFRRQLTGVTCAKGDEAPCDKAILAVVSLQASQFINVVCHACVCQVGKSKAHYSWMSKAVSCTAVPGPDP